MRPVVVLLAALVLTACGPSLTDAQRIWCGSEDNEQAVILAGDSLGIFPWDSLPFPQRPIEGAVPAPSPSFGNPGDRTLIGGIEDGAYYWNEDVETNPEYEPFVDAWLGSGDGHRACLAAYELRE